MNETITIFVKDGTIKRDKREYLLESISFHADRVARGHRSSIPYLYAAQRKLERMQASA